MDTITVKIAIAEMIMQGITTAETSTWEIITAEPITMVIIMLEIIMLQMILVVVLIQSQQKCFSLISYRIGHVRIGKIVALNLF